MTIKNNSNVFNWLSAIFISAMLILGFLFLKEKSVSRINTSLENIDISNSIKSMISPLPRFVPNQKDESWGIRFHTPSDMVEDEGAARENGVYKVYKSANTKKIHPGSVIAISFCKKNDSLPDLRNFVLGFTYNLKTLFSVGQKMTIGLLNLPKDVVKKFEDMAIPYEAILFITEAVANQPSYNTAIFFFETPDGFWLIMWSAPRKILERRGRERDIFLGLIKFMIIEIYHPDTKNLEIYM